MNYSSRMKSSMKNTVYGISTQIIAVLISFVTRTFFIQYLSVEYLGVNGLFSNILTILSLAELGFSGAMIFSLYQPLAIEDYDKVKSLMFFYSNVYKIIGLIVGGLGLTIIPFLKVLTNGANNLDNITYIYLLFLLNSVSSYFFAYKRSILQADQKQYIISKNQLIFNIIKSIMQITILVILKSYILFLGIQVLVTIFENIFISFKVNELYPFLKEENQIILDPTEKKNIWINVKALLIYKVGSTILDGTDNIIISTYVSLIAVGYLSNYVLVVGSISMVLQQLTNAITGSIGNYVAIESIEKQEELLNKIGFVYFITYGFSFVALYTLLNPFISLWLGIEYTLPLHVVFIIAFNWYITGIMNPIWTFRATKGLFIYGKYRPAVSAIINLIVSILLAPWLGLLGVLLGTTATRLSTNSWFDPYIVYKHGFNKSPKDYYMKQIKFIASLSLPIIALSIIFKSFRFESFYAFFIQILLVTIITFGSMFAFFKKTDEFKYFINLIISKH